MLASVGPGAGPCHYEVDDPVLEKAGQCFGTSPGALEELLRPSPNLGREYLDLWQANAMLFVQSGVPAAQISVAGICTMCENHLLFSHRMKDRGRQAAFFALN